MTIQPNFVDRNVPVFGKIEDGNASDKSGE